MALTLRAVSLNDRPLTQPITARFDQQGGTIGRADHNTLALPDPERHISRQQAEIKVGRSGYVIRNIGSANPILVRNHALAQGESAPLMHSDQVRIGGYLLEVVDDALAAADTTATVHDLPSLPARGANSGGGTVPVPLGDLGTPLSRSNPFAELLSPSAATSAYEDEGTSRLPDDYDPFAAAAPAAPSKTPARADLPLPGSETPVSIDALFDLRSSGGRDRLADFLGDGAMAKAAPPLPTDPLALFGGAAPSTAPAELPPDDVPELHAAFSPPKPLTMTAPGPASGPDPEAATPEPTPSFDAGNAAELWEAFCAGTGVRLPAEQLSPALMHSVGQLLRAATAGTLQLMAVRASTRSELHAQVTMIQAQNNNPLKFAPDAESALEQLLQPPRRGFMAGAQAMDDAMHDLLGHSIGTMAGMRAALEGVLGRFAPTELEAKLTGKSVLDSLLPMNRRARLWELYLQHYLAIRDDAQEDFHTLFGKAFLAAYQQQLERLRPRAETPR
ncbi:type VI secretion system-associated FHA domain protein TagH [Roseateles violae]|uniref:Type VI secretion system-associated FHA domain protein TagH n=1 Tax=Roseateles violae TaxID=3058042 RepID=A0ABT8DSK3_9BURK|nr:type VI secretion system-associated FHA domain protein TagH [Pelomonas sp. PFR6]MDN3920010.1 type VI secretion system-associated FHA domain protein TagH [Pelomonas sp. PFR6]